MSGRSGVSAYDGAGGRGGDVPDPHLHSHVVITNAVRKDGRLVAVASRPIFLVGP